MDSYVVIIGVFVCVDQRASGQRNHLLPPLICGLSGRRNAIEGGSARESLMRVERCQVLGNVRYMVRVVRV